MLAATRSEFVKARSIRVTWWSLPLTVVISAGIAYLYSMSMVASGQAAALDESRLRYLVLLGLTMGLIALTVFAVTQIGSEYSTGSIRTSLTAVSSRGKFFVAKSIATGCYAWLTAMAAIAASFVAGQLALGSDGFQLSSLVDMNEAQVPQSFMGACVFLTCMSLFAMGITALLRSSVAAMAILLPLLFLESQGIANIPQIKDYAQYLPLEAGLNVMRVIPADDPRFGHDYGHWTALVILLTWTGAALLAGYLTTKYREA